MKERLIGDDQLLVTADTSLGDPLWDWVAADAARLTLPFGLGLASFVPLAVAALVASRRIRP